MSRGLYSPNGAYPQELPDYWRFEDGTLRTDLPELSDEELEELGWFGPIEMPPPGAPPLGDVSYYTHSYEWNSKTISFNVTEFDEFEKRRRVNYQAFWDGLINTSAYATIKATASQSLEVNTVATEFIALLGDAKNGRANVEKIQEILLEIVENIPFSQEELEEIQEIFVNSGMFAVYTLS
jgi:hypothetical protein